MFIVLLLVVVVAFDIGFIYGVYVFFDDAIKNNAISRNPKTGKFQWNVSQERKDEK